MKRVRLTDTHLLVGDEVAELLTDYAVLLARVNSADRVTLNAISSDGDAVEAIVVLTAASPLVAESAHSNMPEPSNTEAVRYIRSRIEHWDSGMSEPAPSN